MDDRCTRKDDEPNDGLIVNNEDGIVAPEEVVAFAHDVGADRLTSGRYERTGRYKFKLENTEAFAGHMLPECVDMGLVDTSRHGSGLDVNLRMDPAEMDE